MKPLSKQFKWAVVSAVVVLFLAALVDSRIGVSTLVDRFMIRHFGEKDFCLLAYHQEFMRGEHVPSYCLKHLLQFSAGR